MRPRWLVISTMVFSSLASSSTARAQRSLSLGEAVQMALAQEPLVAEAKIAVDRSKLAVLRSQLDRISVKVDATVNELWSKSNIAGATVTSCTVGGVTVNADPTTCASYGGVSSPAAVQSPEGGQGLSNLKANISVPLFSGFQVSSNVAMRQRLEDASVASLRDARRQTALSVARAYWAVRRLAILRDAQRASVQRLAEAEAVTSGRQAAGLAAPIDHNRAVLTRLQRMATAEDLAGQVREQSVQLGILLGSDEELVLVDSSAVSDGLPPPVERLLEEATHDRQDLRRAGFQLEAQRQAVRIAKGNYYPQLGAIGLFQYGNNQFNFGSGVRSTSSEVNPFSSMSGSVTLGLNLSLNIFDTLNTYTSVKDARYEESRMLEERRLAERTVRSDVRAAHAKVMHLATRRVPLMAALDVARDNLVILEARYKNGDALVIEYLQAQVDLADAELTIADVTAQLRLAWLELEASLGRIPGESS